MRRKHPRWTSLFTSSISTYRWVLSVQVVHTGLESCQVLINIILNLLIYEVFYYNDELIQFLKSFIGSQKPLHSPSTCFWLSVITKQLYSVVSPRPWTFENYPAFLPKYLQYKTTYKNIYWLILISFDVLQSTSYIYYKT